MPMRARIPMSNPQNCSCTPVDVNQWEVIQYSQGVRSMKCKQCGNEWEEYDPGNDPVWKSGGMY